MVKQRDEHSPSNFVIDSWPSIRVKYKVCVEWLNY